VSENSITEEENSSKTFEWEENLLKTAKYKSEQVVSSNLLVPSDNLELSIEDI